MKNEEEEEERTCLYCGGVVASLALPILTTKVYINIRSCDIAMSRKQPRQVQFLVICLLIMEER